MSTDLPDPIERMEASDEREAAYVEETAIALGYLPPVQAEALRRRIAELEATVAKLTPKPRCRMRWRAGVLISPDGPNIPDGARCQLEPHGEDVPHKFEER